MKLTTKQLRQIIKEELNEMQTHLGLPHVFTGYDLAGKLYEFADMADPTQPNKQAEQIRQMALNRLVKLRHRLSSEMEGSVEAENLFQEIGMLEEAIDYYDTSMEDWNPNREYKVKPNEPNPEYYPTDKSGQTRMLNRRRRQLDSKQWSAFHKDHTGNRGR